MKTIHCKATQYRRDQRKKDEKNKEQRKRRVGEFGEVFSYLI